jgi:hypothetical protein
MDRITGSAGFTGWNFEKGCGAAKAITLLSSSC